MFNRKKLSNNDPIYKARKKLIFSLALFTGMLVIATAGYYVIGLIHPLIRSRTVLESFYFALVVLTTVGMEGPVTPLDRYFSIFIMLIGIFLAAAAASNLVAFAIDGELNKHFGRRKLEKQISKLKNHFIIVGFGRMGRALCTQMQAKKEYFVLIEKDDQKIKEAQEEGYLYVQGDATDEQVLFDAGLKKAAGLATCLPHDPANVFVTLSARELKEDVEIVARAEDPQTEIKLKRAGANRVICPPLAGAHQLYEILAKPLIVDLIKSTSAETELLDVSVIQIDKVSKLIGKPISETKMPELCGMHITAIERKGEHIYSPKSKLLLEKGDKLYLMGPNGSSIKFVEVFS